MRTRSARQLCSPSTAAPERAQAPASARTTSSAVSVATPTPRGQGRRPAASKGTRQQLARITPRALWGPPPPSPSGAAPERAPAQPGRARLRGDRHLGTGNGGFRRREKPSPRSKTRIGALGGGARPPAGFIVEHRLHRPPARPADVANSLPTS